MHKILICDDNKIQLKVMGMMLEKYAGLYDAEIIAFDNGDDLMEYCISNKFDVIFLDVDLGNRNGLEIARKLKAMDPDFLIVYVSAYDIYYEEMVNAEPFRFIPKDGADVQKQEKRFADALEAAIRRIDKWNGYTYTFNKIEYTIDLDRIAYFHSVARTIHIYGETDGAPAYFYGKMDDLEKELAKIDKNYIRISKSYIVNKRRTALLLGGCYIVYGNKEFPITRKYRKDFNKDGWKVIIR